MKVHAARAAERLAHRARPAIIDGSAVRRCVWRGSCVHAHVGRRCVVAAAVDARAVVARSVRGRGFRGLTVVAVDHRRCSTADEQTQGAQPDDSTRAHDSRFPSLRKSDSRDGNRFAALATAKIQLSVGTATPAKGSAALRPRDHADHTAAQHEVRRRHRRLMLRALSHRSAQHEARGGHHAASRHELSPRRLRSAVRDAHSRRTRRALFTHVARTARKPAESAARGAHAHRARPAIAAAPPAHPAVLRVRREIHARAVAHRGRAAFTRERVRGIPHRLHVARAVAGRRIGGSRWFAACDQRHRSDRCAERTLD